MSQSTMRRRPLSPVQFVATGLLIVCATRAGTVRLETLAPSAGETVGSPSPEMTLTFSAPIDPATATIDSIRLYAVGTNTLTPGPDDTPVVISDIAAEAGNTRLRITTQDPLPAGDYAWVLYGTVSDRSGPGYGLDFDGNLARYDVTPFKTLAEEFTLEAWTRWDSLPLSGSNSWGMIFDVGQNGRFVPGFWLSHHGPELLFGFLRRDGSSGQIERQNAFEVGVWTHIAGVSSPQGLELYVDGVLVGTDSEAFRPIDFADVIDTAICGYSRWAGAYDYIDAFVDELRVWNVARTQAQIAAAMHTPLTGNEPGLLVYHPLDLTTGDVLIDVTGNGYDGNRNRVPRQSSEAPLIEMAAVGLTGADGVLVDVIGDGAPGGVLISPFRVDTSPPRVVGLMPDLSACGVRLAASNLEIAFDDDMDAATLVASNASLVASGGDGAFDDGNEQVVSLADPTYDPASRTVTFSFQPSLPDDTYRFVLTDAVSSVTATALDGEYPGVGGVENPLPSGDGSAGGDFALNFTVDSTLDCNNNGIADSCEDGYENDCNSNQIPDLCDLSAGAMDCNENGVLDECDISSGTVDDLDGNGIIDGCELVIDRVKPCGRFFVRPGVGTDAVRSFDRNGNPVGVFLKGQVDGSGGTLGFDNAGNLLIGQWHDDRVLVMRPGGELVRIINGGGLGWATGTARTPSGGVAVCSYRSDSIKFYDAEGNYLSDLRHSGTEDPVSLAFDRNGNLFVGSRNNGSQRVAVFDDQLAFVKYIGQGELGSNPHDIAFDRLGLLYVATTPGIRKYDPQTGALLATWTHVDLKPFGCAFDESGDLYVTDENSRDVFVFSPQGQVIRRMALDAGPNAPDNLFYSAIAFDVLPDSDCNVNDVADACDIAAEISVDCDFDGAPDECELTGNDCNENGVPDDCEEDCNANGVADECDIADGTAVDCNENGIPDECEFFSTGALPPSDAILNPANGNHYILTNETSWPQAEADAQSLGGHLVTIRNEAENQWLVDTFLPLTSDEGVFTGFNDIASEGNWVWSSGEPVAFVNWGPGEPSGGSEDWGELVLRPFVILNPGDWNDGRVGHPGIVEFVRRNDCNENDILDECDIRDGTSSDCNGNDVPDECEFAGTVDCNDNGVLDLCDPGGAEDCNGNETPDLCDLADATSDDCNENGVPDECEGSGPVVLDWWSNRTEQSCIYSLRGQDARLGNCASGYIEGTVHLTIPDRWDLGFTVLPDEWTGSDLDDYVDVFVNGELVGRFFNNPRAVETPVHTEIVGSSFDYRFEFVSSNSQDHAHLRVQPGLASGRGDCNDNDVLDECDIRDGTSSDCNGNGVPDECEFAGTVDCNDNGVLDLCDPGGTTDCNGNETPDLCDLADATSDDCNENGIPDECDENVGRNALVFDGLDDWVRVPRTPLLEPTDELTIEAWIQPRSIGNAHNSRIVRIAGRAGYILSWRQAGSSKLELRIDGAEGGHCEATDPTPISQYLTQWIHVAAVYSVSQNLCRIYVNGQPKNTTAAVGPLRYSGFDLVLGNNVENGEGFDGLVDEVRIWNVARTPAEIAGHRNVRLNGTETGLVGYWRFDEGDGQIAFDSSPHGNHGVLGNNDDADSADPSWVIANNPTMTGDCNDNDILDECDIRDGTSTDCNGNGVPDECEPEEDCNENGLQDICDLAGAKSDDCNDNGVPDECELVDNDCNANDIPDDCEDCNGNGRADSCDVADDTSADCNGNDVPDECEPDCNENGVTDECDIATGTSFDFDGDGVPDDCKPDCNGNGFPDFLDIAFGQSLDCNENGVPDACDLGDGVSDDCNDNDVPDECDVATTVSDDCDGGGTPDECQPDSNGNGIPDICDGMGDFNHDAHVDIIDYDAFADCLMLSGPGQVPLFVDCLDIFDTDADGHVTIADFAGFQRKFGEQ